MYSILHCLDEKADEAKPRNNTALTLSEEELVVTCTVIASVLLLLVLLIIVLVVAKCKFCDKQSTTYYNKYDYRDKRFSYPPDRIVTLGKDIVVEANGAGIGNPAFSPDRLHVDMAREVHDQSWAEPWNYPSTPYVPG